MSARGGVVVIGVGNPFRGDDGAGPEVARRLRERLPHWVDVQEHDGEPVGLLDTWQGARLAFVVDAVWDGGPAGAVHRLEISAGAPVPASPRRDSSHALGLGDAVELARVLGRLPHRLVLVGIAGDSFEHGDGLSEPVRQAVEAVVDALTDEVRAACA